MANVSEIPWLRPARTLQAIEGGAAAGEKRAALETSANQFSQREQDRASEQTSRDAQVAAQQAQQAQQHAATIAQQQQQTQMEMERTQMQLDARSKIQTQQNLRADQQLKIEGARKDAEFGLRQARLKQLGDAADAKAKEAALQFADHSAFAKEVQSGVPPEKAIYNHPRLMTTSGMTAAMKPPAIPTDTITETQKIPGQSERFASPDIPAHREGGFLGMGGHDVPDQPATPASAATPERTIRTTRKVPSAPDKKVPQQSDIEWLQAHPDLAPKFEKRFGKGSADQFLQPQAAQ